jgi:hypothetical protein
MSDWLLPASFITLLAQFRPVFTAPSFDNFLVLVTGWVHALGMHRISDVLRAAATLVHKHYISYYRFLSAGRWSLDELGITLLCVVLRLLKVRQVELVLDDTLSRRKGKKVALATMHSDPLLRQAGRPFHSYGHVFVVLAVHILATRLAKTGWALPFMFRLFEGPRQGGRADAPSDKKRGTQRRRRGVEQRNRQRLTDRKVVGDKVIACCPRRDTGPLPDGIRPTKLMLAAQMVLKVARQFPHIHFCVLADHLYNGRTLLHEVHSRVQNVTFVVRGHPDAALYELPPPRQPGQRGRPRTRGDRLPNPQTWAAQHRQAFGNVVVPMYGERVTVKVASFVGMSYRTLPGRLVRYVIVKDPKRIYRTQYLMSTDTELSPQQVVAAYARRWPLERTFQEAKHKLGMQDPQTQLPASVRRTAPMALLLYSLVVLWYVANGHDEVQRLRRHRDPWYDKHARPSFTDMLAALRRLGWRRGFLDPAQGDTRRSKMLEVYLDSVAAAA